MFEPNYKITPKITQSLIRVELAKEKIKDLPITPILLASLRESAKLQSTYYSTKIEGNRLTQNEVQEVLFQTKHFKDRKRDEKEVLGYYDGLNQVSKWASENIEITEYHLQRLHALIMGDKRVKFSSYRDGQNVIRDAISGNIIYMPPEYVDVPFLMKDLIKWLCISKIEEVPDPIRAGIAHYQFVTIHPYYDGNGRTARLLANLVLYLSGYDLKGIYSLEEYYAKKLEIYYTTLNVGNSHNYYLGRAEADITDWVEYFCQGMAESFQNVEKTAQKASKNEQDRSSYLRNLDSRQRKILEKFKSGDFISSKDLQEIFKVQPRLASYLANKWVKDGFLEIVDDSKKARKYKLV